MLRLTLLGVAAFMFSVTPGSAEWTCDGTLIVASADESTGPGQGCGNNYLATQTSNDVHQCLRETVVDGTKSRLTHIWRFNDVPAGTISFIYEGNRPANPETDNFKFSMYYDTEEGPFFLLMPGVVISKAFELQGGIKHETNHVTDEQTDFHVIINDTVVNGTHLATVNVDYLAICVE